MNYWELRKLLSKILFPRTQYLFDKSFLTLSGSDIREKGRKKGYAQYNILSNRFERRVLHFKENIIKNFIEVSAHVANCPLPINVDVYDNIRCPFGCIYCFSNRYRASLYTSFYDNFDDVGIRSCSPDYFIPKMEKLLTASERTIYAASPLTKALSMKIPLKIGSRFENLLNIEKEKKATLSMITFLADHKYPFLINTKSTLIASYPYIKVMSSFKKGTAVQMTMISSDQQILSRLEPHAPSIKKRMEACKRLSDAGITVIARIQPLMFFVNDEKNAVDDHIEMMKENGIRDVTMENMSFGILTPKMKENFYKGGFDIDKVETFTTFSQRIASLLMSKFSSYIREKEINVSSNDFGQTTENSHEFICCGISEKHPWNNLNYGNIFTAIRFIQRRGKPTSWSDFDSFVQQKGGFLSESIQLQVRNMWNLGLYVDKDKARAIDFGAHLLPVGEDDDGLIWKYDKDFDFRKEPIQKMLEEIL